MVSSFLCILWRVKKHLYAGHSNMKGNHSICNKYYCLNSCVIELLTALGFFSCTKHTTTSHTTPFNTHTVLFYTTHTPIRPITHTHHLKTQMRHLFDSRTISPWTNDPRDSLFSIGKGRILARLCHTQGSNIPISGETLPHVWEQHSAFLARLCHTYGSNIPSFGETLPLTICYAKLIELIRTLLSENSSPAPINIAKWETK